MMHLAHSIQFWPAVLTMDQNMVAREHNRGRARACSQQPQGTPLGHCGDMLKRRRIPLMPLTPCQHKVHQTTPLAMASKNEHSCMGTN